MHDALFEHQHALEDGDLLAYAVPIGLNAGQFTRDLAHHTFASDVREDFMGGVRSGVNGTPTFFINGQRHDEAWDLDTLVDALKEAASAFKRRH